MRKYLWLFAAVVVLLPFAGADIVYPFAGTVSVQNSFPLCQVFFLRNSAGTLYTKIYLDFFPPQSNRDEILGYATGDKTWTFDAPLPNGDVTAHARGVPSQLRVSPGDVIDADVTDKGGGRKDGFVSWTLRNGTRILATGTTHSDYVTIQRPPSL